jgi:hypothetical protein
VIVHRGDRIGRGEVLFPISYLGGLGVLCGKSSIELPQRPVSEIESGFEPGARKSQRLKNQYKENDCSENNGNHFPE